MNEETNSENLSNAELYKKLLGKTPFVKPWMEPYLPEDVVLRDIIVLFFAWIFCLIIIGAFYFLSEQFFGDNDKTGFITMIAMGLALAFSVGPIFSRYTVATVKLRMIKNRMKKL